MKSLRIAATLICLGILGGCVTPTAHWDAIKVLPGEVSRLQMAKEEQEREHSNIKSLAHQSRADTDQGKPYQIGAGDELIVTVQGRPDLGSQMPEPKDARRNIALVQEDGSIDLALLTGIQVRGLTTKQAAEAVQRAYRFETLGVNPGFKKNELLVGVNVSKYSSQSIYVSAGETPQQRIFLSNTIQTLKDVVASSEGINTDVDTANATLIRNGISYSFDYTAYKRGESDVGFLILEENDQIYFPSARERVIYIFGEVAAPGIHTIPSTGLSLLDALGISGGPDVITANYNSVYLLRPSAKAKPTIYKLKLRDILKAEPLALHAQDRIFVPPSRLSRWSRSWQQALPFFSAGSAVGVTHRNFSSGNTRNNNN